MSWATLFGFSFIGMAINFVFLDKRPLDLFLSDKELYLEFTCGIGFGILAAIVAIIAVKNGLAKQLSSHLGDLFEEGSVSMIDAIFFSLCAGIGEEILFRAGIQPFLGIIVTSVLFVAIHGYLNVRHMNVFAYGLIMVGISIGLGSLFDQVGLISAIAAHTVFDIVMFYFLLKKGGVQPQA